MPSVRLKIAAPFACACARDRCPVTGFGSSTVTHSTGYVSPGRGQSASKFGRFPDHQRLERAAERRKVAPLARLAVGQEAVERSVAAVLGLVEAPSSHATASCEKRPAATIGTGVTGPVGVGRDLEAKPCGTPVPGVTLFSTEP